MVAYSFQQRFVTPIQVGLGKIEHIPGTEFVPKRQTIRAVGKRRHARPGETVQLYRGMRTRQCFKIGDGCCKSIEPIQIFLKGASIVFPDRQDRTIQGAALDFFAQDDGFKDWPEMRQFWLDEHGEECARLGPFTGLLIKWEPIHGR